MSGLILLAALITCWWLGYRLVRFVGNLVPNPAWKGPVKVGVAMILLAAPFVDEVIGMYQFNALCKANGIESADVSRAQGKRVKAEYGVRHPQRRTVMPIHESDVRFTDADTGEVLIQHKNYYAKGGWVMRYTPISLGNVTPMLFDGNGCGFDVKDRIFSMNNVLQIN